MIQEFIGKAQSKIGELGYYIAERKHDRSSLELCKELIDVVKCLTDERLGWTEEFKVEVVNYYNLKAELNNIPYVNIVGYQVKVNKIIGVGGEKTTSVDELYDYVSKTIGLINNTPHNNLKAKQGGDGVNEYYHVTKEMYDWLVEQLNPYVVPTVSLVTLPSGVRERGTSLLSVRLTGSYVINSGKSVLRTMYYRGSTLLAENTGLSIDNEYTDTQSLNNTTTYKYAAEFEVGGIKEVSKTIQFVLPYYSGLTSMEYSVPATMNVTQLSSMVKVVGSKPSQVNVTFSIPEGNAMAKTTTMNLLVPAEYGLFTKIYVDNNPMFDYITEWSTYLVNLTLANGEVIPYRWYKFKEATEGTFNFNFRWQ